MKKIIAVVTLGLAAFNGGYAILNAMQGNAGKAAFDGGIAIFLFGIALLNGIEGGQK